MRQEKSAGAVIFQQKDGQILFLLLKYTRYWGFAKGWVEEGENDEEAAIREVREETSLQVSLIPGFKFEQKWTYKIDNEWSKKHAIYFLAQVHNPEVKISEEHEDFRWVSLQDSLKLMKIKNNKEMIRAACEFIEKNFKQDKQTRL